MMDAARFHNALRVLLNLEPDDLRNAGVVNENWGTIEASTRDQLRDFIGNPIREALRMPDANFERLFELIEQCQGVKDDRSRILAALKVAQSFIQGFEGDELQEGVDEMLTQINAALEGEGTAEPLAKPHIRYASAKGRTLEEMRSNVPAALSNVGDTRLIWVNEGDLCFNGEEVV